MGFYGTLKMIFYKVSRNACLLFHAFTHLRRPRYPRRASPGRLCGHCGGCTAAQQTPRDAALIARAYMLCCVALCWRCVKTTRFFFLAPFLHHSNFSRVNKRHRTDSAPTLRFGDVFLPLRVCLRFNSAMLDENMFVCMFFRVVHY